MRDVVDKVYKPEYKWEMRRKNRYGMGRWSKEKRDKQQGQIKGVEMPRGPRLDAPGTLHHAIIRGIERCKIVDSDKDREDFVTRMGSVALETETSIYAWSCKKASRKR
jgi:hypothetical protein